MLYGAWCPAAWARIDVAFWAVFLHSPQGAEIASGPHVLLPLLSR